MSAIERGRCERGGARNLIEICVEYRRATLTDVLCSIALGHWYQRQSPSCLVLPESHPGCTERIESLGAKQKVKLLEHVLTPEIELRFAMEHMARRTRHVPSRALDRATDRAIREVRRERATRSKP